MAITEVTSQIMSTLIKERGPKYFAKGINQAVALLKSGLLKEEKFDGEEWTHTLYPSANHSTGAILDGGILPTPGSGLQAITRVMPKVVYSGIRQGRVSAKLKMKAGNASGMAKQLDVELKERAADLGRTIDRMIIGNSIAPQAGAVWTSTAANGTVTVPFLDVGMFRVGAAYDFIDLSSSKGYVVRCTGVTPAALGANSANVAGNVSFINDVINPATNSVTVLTDTTVATGDTFAIRGTTAGFGASSAATGAVIAGFDAASGATTFNASFQGVDPAVYPDLAWVGNYIDHNAVYSQEAMLGFHARTATLSDVASDVVVVHPQVAAAHAASGDYHGAAFGLTAGYSPRFTQQIKPSTDKYGNLYEDSGLRINGAKIVADTNAVAGRVIMFSSEHVRLVKWDEVGPDEEAGDPRLLGRSTYTSEVQVSGVMNMAFTKRNCIGIVDRITGL